MQIIQRWEILCEYDETCDCWSYAQPSDHFIEWIHEVPIKILCFVWRAHLSRIPSAYALISRGVALCSSVCSFCSCGIEDAYHILLTCPFAKEVWEWTFRWCNIDIPLGNSVADFIVSVGNWIGSPIQKKDLITICYGTLWLIWKTRCDRIFKQLRISPILVADNVTSLSFTWIKHRRSQCQYKWVDWCVCPNLGR